MLKDITAPAPRFLLRFLLIDKLLKHSFHRGQKLEAGCEIGPGLGDVAHYFLRKNIVSRMVLFEGSEAAREILKERFAQNSSVVVNEEFTVSNERYDIVICCEVIEHIDNDKKFLQSISDSLVNGGVLIGSVPCYMSKWQAVDELAGHYRRYEHKELVDKLNSAGFDIDIIECYGFPLINLLYPVRQYYYSKKLKAQQGKSMEEATAKSGISRGLAMLFSKKLVFYIVKIAFLFQSIPFLTRFGDGFVFVCRKK